MWLKPENRCLVPANSFAEYAPEPNPETKKKDVVWFALSHRCLADYRARLANSHAANHDARGRHE
jgi:hypothetical protein